MKLNEILIVMLGGGIGSAMRYIVVNAAAKKLSPFFPYGTFIVNFIGCFLIGLCMAFILNKPIFPPYFRLLIIVGFLGGLTTFSSFSYDTINLLQNDQYSLAFANIGLNIIAGFSATFLGISCARALI